MRQVAKWFVLAMIATAAGMALQCASDRQAISGLIADLGLGDGKSAREASGTDGDQADGRRADGIGPKADGAEPPPADWFTMRYTSSDAAEQRLLVEGSEIDVQADTLVGNGRPVPVMNYLKLAVLEASRGERITLSLIGLRVTGPSTIAATSFGSSSPMLQFFESCALVEGSCAWEGFTVLSSPPSTATLAGQLRFTEVSLSRVSGSYDLSLTVGSRYRRLAGEFSTTPYYGGLVRLSQPAELRQ